MSESDSGSSTLERKPLACARSAIALLELINSGALIDCDHRRLVPPEVLRVMTLQGARGYYDTALRITGASELPQPLEDDYQTALLHAEAGL